MMHPKIPATPVHKAGTGKKYIPLIIPTAISPRLFRSSNLRMVVFVLSAVENNRKLSPVIKRKTDKEILAPSKIAKKLWLFPMGKGTNAVFIAFSVFTNSTSSGGSGIKVPTVCPTHVNKTKPAAILNSIFLFIGLKSNFDFYCQIGF